MDEEIADLRIRMADAAAADVEARSSEPKRPAMQKLKLLPEVMALLNRNGREVENAIVDPETNLMESVRFFLEPLRDGSMPAYNIQRDLFAALDRLPINTETLKASGLGKLIVFYTKTKKIELSIKRQAERLFAEWARPILKRSDDYRMRKLETRAYDPTAAAAAAQKAKRAQGMSSQEETPEQRRARQLAVPDKSNRARIDVQRQSYTIVPQSQVRQGDPQFARPMGASGDEAFRRMRARQLAAQGKGPKRG
jgi:transcription factor SPN1